MTESNTSSLIEDAVSLIMTSFTEVVPTDAQLHLLNAQRELLLALTIIVQHNLSRSVDNPRGDRKRKATRQRPKRVSID